MNTLPNPLDGDWVDSMADWSVTHQKLSEHDLDRFIAERIPTPACSSCGGECATPQACERPLQEPDLSRFFFLAPYLARYPWLGPVLITCVVIVWMCLDAYLEATQ